MWEIRGKPKAVNVGALVGAFPGILIGNAIRHSMSQSGDRFILIEIVMRGIFIVLFLGLFLGAVIGRVRYGGRLKLGEMMLWVASFAIGFAALNLIW